MAESKATKPVNIYAKLAKAREDFLSETLTKSGKNIHAEFEYFELKDIVPTATKVFGKYGLIFIVTFVDGSAIGTLYDTEDPTKVITVSFALAHLPEPAKFRMNEIQAVGAEITYYRRYLYMMILDTVDRDAVDADTAPAPAPKPVEKKAPVSEEERKTITAQLTAEENADEESIAVLKIMLKKLMEHDPGKEEFVQTIAVKTDGFKTIKAAACDTLIAKVNEMLKEYEG